MCNCCCNILSGQNCDELSLTIWIGFLLPAICSRYLFYCMFFWFFLFGQRFLKNPRADSRQILRAGVLLFRMCLLPFRGLAAPGGGQKKGEMKFSLLYESLGNFCILVVFQRYLGKLWTDPHQILYVYGQCLPTCPFPFGVHRPLAGWWRGVKNSKNGGGLVRAADSYHFYFSQRFQMWFNMSGTDLRTVWYRTVKVVQGVSTGWAESSKKFQIFYHVESLRPYISETINNRGISLRKSSTEFPWKTNVTYMVCHVIPWKFHGNM